MRFQAGGIAVAFIAIAGVPAIVGQVTQAPSAAVSAPAPKEATLTVALEGAEKTGPDTARLRVLATGGAPAAPNDLLSPDGEQVVSVSALTEKECERLPVLQAVGTAADDTWCLGLEGVDDGSQVAGKLPGAATTLALAVTRRPSFWDWPLAVVLGGIAVGLAAVSIPVWLRRRIRRNLLDRELAANRERGKAGIVGLEDWVSEQRSAGTSDDELLPVVIRVIEEGPGIAERGRNALRDRLFGSSLPASSAYRAGAEDFFAEHRELKVEDFISEGKLTGAYPSAEWIVGLETLERQWREVARFKDAIKDGVPDAEDAMKKVSEAEEALMAADRPESVAGAVEKVDAVRGALGTAVAAMAKASVPVESRVELWAVTGSHLARFAVGPADLSPERLRVERPSVRPGRLWPYVLFTVCLIGLALVFSVASVEHGVFAPAKAFGGWEDCFALFSAAVAAGAGSSVIALLSPWDGRRPSEA